jgi:hypothetical protein
MAKMGIAAEKSIAFVRRMVRIVAKGHARGADGRLRPKARYGCEVNNEGRQMRGNRALTVFQTKPYSEVKLFLVGEIDEILCEDISLTSNFTVDGEDSLVDFTL